MNNCTNKEFERVMRRESVRGDSGFEKLIDFFCALIVFFERAVVVAIVRIVSAVILSVASYFYVSAIMSGSVGVFEIIFRGVLIVGITALIYGNHARDDERGSGDMSL